MRASSIRSSKTTPSFSRQATGSSSWSRLRSRNSIPKYGSGVLHEDGRRLGYFDLTVPHVCNDCNRTWMSDMETRRRNIVLPHATGHLRCNTNVLRASHPSPRSGETSNSQRPKSLGSGGVCLAFVNDDALDAPVGDDPDDQDGDKEGDREPGNEEGADHRDDVCDK